MKLSIKSCEWDEIKALVASNIKENKMTIDSFLEDHIINSNHYKITCENEIVGYFCIHDNTKLVGFYLDAYHSNLSQQVFSEIKKYEEVKSAMVPTSDEYFLSHCLDNYSTLSKQAYFSIYTDKEYDKGYFHELEVCPVVTEEDIKALDFTEDFFSEEDKEILITKDYYKAFVMKHDTKVIGCGCIEYGRVDRSIASTGMFVSPDYRQMGYGKSILKALQLRVESEGYIARSGCWYYNHNSKKSMESAGAYSKTRLMNFEF